MNLSRRKFIQGLLAGGAGLTTAGRTQGQSFSPAFPSTVDFSGLMPPTTALKIQPLGLGKFFPGLVDPDAAGVPHIVNTLSDSYSLAGYNRLGESGNAVFVEHAGGRVTLPWAPVFARENNLLQLPLSVTKHIDCSELLVVNESSTDHPVFGNKARKYEFLLPNLKWSGAQRLSTMGAVSSNHTLQFALANRMADLTGEGQPLNSPLDLVLFEVPGAETDTQRLAILRGLVQNVTVAHNTIELAADAAYEYGGQWLNPKTDTVVPPGGSNEVSALGHMNAVAELAQVLDTAQAWTTPPDVIFVAMGSGSTVLGLLLGVHLMGWKTKVVGVADQDKSYVTRLVANQQPSLPFVEGNVARLARSTVDWLQKIQFPGISPDTLDILQRDIFVPDSNSWGPGYGLIEASDVAWEEELKAAGLGLDPVFTLKAWRSLLAMSDAGALKNKKVLFWNTYNSFDYEQNVSPIVSAMGQPHAWL